MYLDHASCFHSIRLQQIFDMKAKLLSTTNNFTNINHLAECFLMVGSVIELLEIPCSGADLCIGSCLGMS